VWDGFYDRHWEEEVWKLKRGLGWHSISSSPLHNRFFHCAASLESIKFNDAFVRALLVMILY
jgi:hypothetical protein